MYDDAGRVCAASHLGNLGSGASTSLSLSLSLSLSSSLGLSPFCVSGCEILVCLDFCRKSDETLEISIARRIAD